jgi:eukaryotic-like serine/threonine-protein kinase
MGLPGNLLAGRYRLDEPIGRGGFSEVWRATDAVLARPVAVKLLRPGYDQQPEVLVRFQAEARRAAVLWHENIAHVYDYDASSDGLQPYLVMELVDGPCLAGALAGGPLSAMSTMDIVAQTAAGLQAAHAVGLIHRDIKPGNLLLASDGTVKITDFGISRAIGSAPVTATGFVMGSAGYLAPERIAGARATPASDLYALGIVAYECLAGEPPFAGKPLDVACAHRDRPVPPLLASVPAGVSALVMQLVAKDPAWRPASAEVVHRAGRLRQDLQDGLSVGAGRTRYLLADPAPAAVPPPAAVIAVPPPAAVIAPAAFAAEARRPVPAAPWPGSRRRPGARRRRRRPVPVLAAAAIAGLLTMVLAITVGAALVRHPAGALPSAPLGRPASGTVAAPPARQPSSARPGPKVRSRTSLSDTSVLQMAISDHRTVTAPDSSREKIRRHRHGKDPGQRRGRGRGDRQGNGTGHGNGNGNGQGNGHGRGNGDAPVLSVLYQLPGRGFWRDGNRASGSSFPSAYSAAVIRAGRPGGGCTR